MAAEAADIATLASLIGSSRRVGIDGTHGIGKSTLARQLGAFLNLPVIELDQFVDKHQGTYVGHIKYPVVRSQITAPEGFIIEGICLLQILERLGVPLECLVYVKRMHLGLWADENECVFPEGVDQALANERRDVETFSEWEAHQRVNRTSAMRTTTSSVRRNS